MITNNSKKLISAVSNSGYLFSLEGSKLHGKLTVSLQDSEGIELKTFYSASRLPLALVSLRIRVVKQKYLMIEKRKRRIVFKVKLLCGI